MNRNQIALRNSFFTFILTIISQKSKFDGAFVLAVEFRSVSPLLPNASYTLKMKDLIPTCNQTGYSYL